jgi:hypothetical protein
MEKKSTHFVNHPETALQYTIRDNALLRLNDAIKMAVSVLEISGGIKLERFKNDISRIIERLVPIENRIYYGGDPSLSKAKNKRAEKLFKETKQLLEDLQLDTKAIGKNSKMQDVIDNLNELKEIVSEPFLLQENLLKNIVKNIIKEEFSNEIESRKNLNKFIRLVASKANRRR